MQNLNIKSLRYVEKGYDFDDLLLIPAHSNVISREHVSLETDLGKGLILNLPVIGSPMKGIMSKELAYELHKAGGIGILHRFYDSYNPLFSDMIWLNNKNARYGIAIGLDDLMVLTLLDIYLDSPPEIICIDVANGYLESVIEFTSDVSEYLINNYEQPPLLMVGNVVDVWGAKSLYDAGADLIRVGIGSGGLCTTRNVTGVGYPQLSAIDDCSLVDGHIIIADGGIRNSGDAVKALAVGAKAVMLGSVLGKAKESAHNGIIYGMASRKMQDEYYHSVKSVEGIEKEMAKTAPALEILDEFAWGIKSACTYLDAETLDELRDNAEWVEVGRGSIKQL